MQNQRPHEDESTLGSRPIQLLVNYWEIQPSALGSRLDDLMRHGVNHVAAFVPWQAVESDISHTLARFLQALNDRRMTISLILTPEVGVHYPNSGLPKDVLKPESQAQHSGQPIASALPPNAFGLPTYFSQEFSKRYYGYLSRIDAMLADLGKANSGLLRGVTIVMTGSYWKYHRSAQSACQSVFGGLGGDASNAASLAYRQCVDQFFSQREFQEPNAMAANRWKSRQMDDVNRRWFYQQSEEVFRHRSFQALRRKAVLANVQEVELFTPEADPSAAYSQLLMSLTGGHGDFFKLSQLVDEAAARASRGSLGYAPTYIHWSSIGSFRTLSDPEKQFLILKSLLMTGARGGGVLIDESEWFSLSQTFRGRTETFGKLIQLGGLRLPNRALYLSPHLWSQPGLNGRLWNELKARVGSGARMVASVDLVAKENDASLVIVDPQQILTQQTVQRLTQWARSGRVVVLPKNALYTEAAKAELEKISHESRRLEIDLGVPYRLNQIGQGKLIVYDTPDGVFGPNGDPVTAWQTFITAVLSVAEVQASCRMSDARITAVPLERRDGGLGLFVMNGTRQKLAADLIFQGEVGISDLAAALSGHPAQAREGAGAAASRFALDVPPCGVLPLAVEGDILAPREKPQATAESIRKAEGDPAWN